MSLKLIACLVSVLLVNYAQADTFVDSFMAGSKKENETSRDLTASTKRTFEDLQYLALGVSSPNVKGSIDIDYSYSSLFISDPSKVTRLAGSLSAGGPRYPSVCTQSLISDLVPSHKSQEFDVIILEYFTRALDGLYDLAKRLRVRYPDASIILINVWQPNQINWFEDGSLVGNLQEWAESNSLDFKSSDFFEKLKDPSLDLRWWGFEQRDKVAQKIRRDFGASLRGGGMQRGDPKEALIKYAGLYDDYENLSVSGHSRLADVVKNTVESFLASYPLQPRIGTWGDGDECRSWYMSGNPPRKYSDNLEMEDFGPTHALSSGTRRPNGGGWIRVYNPFAGKRGLFLSYMASGPPYSRYPTTQIRVNSKDEDGNFVQTRVILHPKAHRRFNKRANVILSSKVADIPPGHSWIYWTPLEQAEKPFRITATQVVSMSVEDGGCLGPNVDYSGDY